MTGIIPCVPRRRPRDGARVPLPGGRPADAYRHQLIVGVFNVDPEQTRASFRRLAELEFDAVSFGHGAPMKKDASLEFRRLAERLGR